MPDSLALQVDVGSLSLTSFGALSNILTALSADDVQPIAMIQLQNLGAAFHVSGPITTKIPDYLQRFHSTRLERLGIAVGWRKGDFASLMAQSIGGQASSLLAAFLCNLFKESAGNILHGASSKGLLPRSACLCSPSQLERAAQLLANKLAVVAVGTLVAKQVCRIHEAYRQLHQSVPINLLDDLSEEGMVELLVKISFALRKENSMVRIQGTCCMGYIVTLVVTLFADDSIVTIEGLVIHQGSHSSSIVVDIVANSGEQPTQVETMDKLNSLNEVLSSAQFSGADVGLKHFCGPSPSHQSFAWKGLISARLTTLFQQWDLVCPPQVITAIGVCALSVAEITYLDLEIGCHSKSFSKIIKSPVTDLLGKNHRVIMHDRCEIVTGVPLPRTWPSYSEAFTRLDELMKELMETIPEDSSCATFWDSREEINRRGFSHGFTGQVIDTIWLAFTTLFVNGHPDAIWRTAEYDKGGYSTHPDHPCWGDPTQPGFAIQFDLICSQLSPQWSSQRLAVSDWRNTLIPSIYLTLGQGDICDNRGIEMMDGIILHNERYHQVLTDAELPDGSGRRMSPLRPPNNPYPILPTTTDIRLSLTYAIVERLHGLTLHVTAVLPGEKLDVSFAKCHRGLLKLTKTDECAHPREIPLQDKYVKSVVLTSVEAPDIEVKNSNETTIVQTAGNPTAQFLSLCNRRALFCHHSCLNCAYEQAISLTVSKIIIS